MVFLASLFVALGFAAGAFSADLLVVETLMGQESLEAINAGFTVDMVDQTTFNSYTTAQFSAYKAIVFGDPYCGTVNDIEFLNTNRAAWSSAVTGNIILLGAEAGRYYSYAGVQTFLTNSLRFAASSPNSATGLFFSLSCYFRGAATPTPVDTLLNFGTFNVEQTLNSTNSTNCAQHIVATTPVLSGVTDDNLRNWCGAREKFTTYPSSGSSPFVPLAIVEEAGGTTFADGTIGFPYVLARAVTPAASNTSTTATTEASTTAVSTMESSTAESFSTEGSTTEMSTTGVSTGESSTETSSMMSSASTEASSTTGSSLTPRSSSTVDETSSTSPTPYLSSRTSETSSSLETSASSGSEPLSTATSSLQDSESSSGLPSFTDLNPSSTSDNNFINTSTTSILDSETSGTSSVTSSLATSESLATSVVNPTTPDTLPAPSSSTTISTPTGTGPLTTPSSAPGFSSSVTSLASNSSTGTLPSTTPTTPRLQATFIIQVIFTLRNKRQLAPRFATVNSAGNVQVTTSCLESSLFSITDDGRMTSNSLFARALPASVTAGSGLFTFALPQAGEVDTTFLISGRNILWNNIAFGNGNAVFAINPTTQLFEVFYSGAPPLNYQTIAFQTFFGDSVAGACAALAGSTTSTTPLSTPSLPVPATTSPSNLVPVGIEIVVYVIIRTIIVGGETICLTDAGQTSTNFIYRSAVPGYPCYACLLASQDIECPNDEKNKFTIVTSSCTEPNSALFTAKPSAVYNPCPTCASTTLRGAAVTPGVAAAENLAGFSPMKTMTINGGEVVFGSKSVDGQVVNTALVKPENAPPPISGPPAAPPAAKPAGDVKPAGDSKPVGVDYTSPGLNSNPKPVQVDSPDKPPVDVGNKGAETTPPDVPQPPKPVLTSSAPSFASCLNFLHFILLVLFI